MDGSCPEFVPLDFSKEPVSLFLGQSHRVVLDSVFCVFEDSHNEGSLRALSCSEYRFARNSSLRWLEDNEPVGKYLTWAIVAVPRKEMIARAKRSRISHQRWKVYCKFSDTKEQ